jgi:ribonuclease/clavin/mitogillin
LWQALTGPRDQPKLQAVELTYKRAACLILLRRAGGDVEVYLVKRSEKLVFLGGFYAFPGGRVDAGDADVQVPGAPKAVDFCSAAIRELFEETGVLLAAGATDLSAADRTTFRHALESDPTAWGRGLGARRLRLDGAPLVPMGKWLTPPFAHVAYDAQYFAAWLPEGEAPEIWPGELTEGIWLTPARAIEHHEAGTLFISYPVLETLRVLAEAGDDLGAAAAVLEAREATYPHGGGEMVYGVHALALRTITLPPATHTNCYLLGNAEVVIVDPGTPFADEQERLLGYLEHLRGQGSRLREIWVTHYHADHIGAVDLLRQRYGLSVAAHADTRAALGDALRVDRQIADDEILTLADGASWQALHTPGHAHGHLCFHETRRGHLLSGDNILGMGTSVVPPSPEGSMVDYLASLRRVQRLKLGMIFPGHGPPVAAASGKIEQYLAHRQDREAKIFDALGSPASTREIVARVYTDVDPSLHVLAEATVRAHLEKLEAEGKVAHAAGIYSRRPVGDALS